MKSSETVAPPLVVLTKLAYPRKEAAALLSISPRKLDEWVADGLITPSRLCGRKPLFTAIALQRLVVEMSKETR